jgi:hypothetical protein
VFRRAIQTFLLVLGLVGLVAMPCNVLMPIFADMVGHADLEFSCPRGHGAFRHAHSCDKERSSRAPGAMGDIFLGGLEPCGEVL